MQNTINVIFTFFFFCQWSLFCQPHQITQVIEHEWLCKLTLAVPRQHYQQAWRKCWLWWKRTHLQIKLHIIREILVPIFSQVKDYIGFSLFSLFNFCSHIFDFFFLKKILFWGLPWGLIAKTPCSQRRGPASHPCLGD